MKEGITVYFREFLNFITGEFSNKNQVIKNPNLPNAVHINTICTSLVSDLPANFKGEFIIEESYYTKDGKTTVSPHFFLFEPSGERIKLTSYEIPRGYAKESFTAKNFVGVSYASLVVSQKFTPAYFIKNNEFYEGGSESMFSPVTKFVLKEKFYQNRLIVDEKIYRENKMIFGFLEPIIYERLL